MMSRKAYNDNRDGRNRENNVQRGRGMYLKERLAAGECLLGAGIYSNSPEVMEYAAVGMDWIWWEPQHIYRISKCETVAMRRF